MTPPLHYAVIDAFHRRFEGAPALVVRAPGRVNLIGEHTDYNDGYVLPMAITRNVWLAARPRSDRRVVVHSQNFDNTVVFSLDALTRQQDSWGIYIQGIAWILQELGLDVIGWDGVIASDVPVGSGLSSSAALELAAARCFAALAEETWDPVKMAGAAQRAENEWVGMQCGIMDQLISAAGQRGKGLFIDCRSLELRPVELPADTCIVVMDTATRRGLVDSAYNERRSQCDAAASHFGVAALRDVSLEAFEAEADRLDATIMHRARHVITENARTREAARALSANDPEAFGRLMNASHLSLRDDFEVTNEALNTMVELAREEGCCLGARMTGGGFGGCAIALVQQQAAAGFIERVAGAYRSAAGIEPALFLTVAEQGAALEPTERIR
jgi:galactokinase